MESKYFFHIFAGLFSILIAVVGWIWTTCYTKLITIEKELISIKVELVQMQASQLTREEVNAMIDTALLKHGIK